MKVDGGSALRDNAHDTQGGDGSAAAQGVAVHKHQKDEPAKKFVENDTDAVHSDTGATCCNTHAHHDAGNAKNAENGGEYCCCSMLCNFCNFCKCVVNFMSRAFPCNTLCGSRKCDRHFGAVHFSLKNFVLRFISAVVLALLALYCVYSGGYTFFGMTVVVSLLGLTEWVVIVHKGKHSRQNLWQLDMYALGILYTLLFCWAMFFLRSQEHGVHVVVWCLGITWATDIGAYLIGSYVGGPKLAPVLSPQKTWAGFVGGLVSATVVGSLFFKNIPSAATFNHTVMLSFMLSLCAQCGDLNESWFKRKFGVKNSSNLIPGHGGVLDRIDSLVFVVIMVAMIKYFS